MRFPASERLLMEQAVRARIDELVERRGLAQADARARCAHFARDEFYALKTRVALAGRGCDRPLWRCAIGVTRLPRLPVHAPELEHPKPLS
jgi:hypothetical protein